MKSKKVIIWISVLMLFLCFSACAEQNKPNSVVHFTITFLLDGGKFSDKDISELEVEEGTRLDLKKYIPEKDAYIFSGWLMNETKYAEDDFIVVNSDITLKALWEPVPIEKFVVTFDPDGGFIDGSSAVKKVEVEKNAKLDFSDYIPERKNYIFKGWRLGESVFDSGLYTVVSNILFTAIWEKVPSSDINFVFEAATEEEGYIIKGLAKELETNDLTVPGYYDGKPVIRIANNAFSYNNVITSIDLSLCEKLEEIGNWNFSACSVLVSVNLEGCESLEKIGSACFNGLPSTKEINLKGLRSLREIGSQCFRGSEQTPLNVAELDFSECISLKSIGQMSFWYVNVTELDFSHTQIGTFERQTIHYSTALETLKLPKTLDLTQNSSEFCSRCENLSEIILDPMNIFMTVDNNALMDADKTVIFKYAVKSSATVYKAPESVKTVMSCAFYKAEQLEEIDFMSARMTEIGYAAFSGCVDAALKMPFGEDGTYEDGSQSCKLERDWNEGVKSTEYGEPAKSFFFETDLIDGSTVTESEFDFTASAKYGPSFKPEICNLTVKLNGVQITGENGNFTVTLTDGNNTIELIADFQGKTETKQFSVIKVGKGTICTDLASSSVSGKVSFNVWVERAGQRVDIEDMQLEVTVAYDKANSFSSPSYVDGWLTVGYSSEEKCFKVTVDFEALYNVGFYDYYKLKIEIIGSGCDSYVTEDLKYEETF